MPRIGARKMNAAVLITPQATIDAEAARRDAGADQAADQGVAAARRDAEEPGQEVPDDRAHQRAEDDHQPASRSRSPDR